MLSAVIVDAVRTPVGKHYGALSGLHPATLLGALQQALLQRTGLSAEEVAQIIGGCVIPGRRAVQQRYPSGMAARRSALHPGSLPPGAITAGIGCGVESMSRVFLGQATTPETGSPYPDDWTVDMGDQFTSAERIVHNRGIPRADADALGVRSQQRTARAWAESRFDGQTAPVAAPEVVDHQLTGNTVTVTSDQGLRETTLEGLAKLKAVVPEGIHTAGNSSQISDGAAAVLLMDERFAGSLYPAESIETSLWRDGDHLALLARCPERDGSSGLTHAHMEVRS